MNDSKHNEVEASNLPPSKKHLIADTILWKELRNRKLISRRFERQRNLFGHIVDFYCYDLKLVIIVSPYHKGPGFIHEQELESLLEEKKIHVLRFDYNSIIDDIAGVIKTIQDWIHNYQSEHENAGES